MSNDSHVTGSLWPQRIIRIARWGTVAVVVEFALFVASFLLVLKLEYGGLVGDALPVAFLGFGLVILVQLFRGAFFAVGWIFGGVLLGASLGGLMAPTISDGAWRHFWAAEYILGGAVVGMAIGVIVSLVVCRFRFVILRLIELVTGATGLARRKC